MFRDHYRLHSVRNKVIPLQPLPAQKQRLKAVPWVKLAWVFIGASSCSIAGLVTASLLASVLQPVTMIARVAPRTITIPEPETPPSSSVPTTDLAQSANSSQQGRQTASAVSRSSPEASILLPTTSSNQRVAEITTGRRNPFTLVKTPAALMPTPLGSKQPQSAVNRKSKPSPTSQATLSTPQAQPEPSPIPPPPIEEGALAESPAQVAVAPSPSTPPVQPNFPAPLTASSPNSLPPPPSGSPFPSGLGNSGSALSQSTLACKVEVNGVLQSRGEPLAVLKSADEPYPRTLRIGDRLCSGLVAIKGIVDIDNPQPTVIFDQSGREIAQRVDTSSGAE